jgi:hypothetical protein
MTQSPATGDGITPAEALEQLLASRPDPHALERLFPAPTDPLAAAADSHAAMNAASDRSGTAPLLADPGAHREGGRGEHGPAAAFTAAAGFCPTPATQNGDPQ